MALSTNSRRRVARQHNDDDDDGDGDGDGDDAHGHDEHGACVFCGSLWFSCTRLARCCCLGFAGSEPHRCIQVRAFCGWFLGIH